jgi:hypothetical protein
VKDGRIRRGPSHPTRCTRTTLQRTGSLTSSARLARPPVGWYRSLGFEKQVAGQPLPFIRRSAMVAACRHRAGPLWVWHCVARSVLSKTSHRPSRSQATPRLEPTSPRCATRAHYPTPRGHRTPRDPGWTLAAPPLRVNGRRGRIPASSRRSTERRIPPVRRAMPAQLPAAERLRGLRRTRGAPGLAFSQGEQAAPR